MSPKLVHEAPFGDHSHPTSSRLHSSLLMPEVRDLTTDELEELLEGADETDALEFKQAMSWDTSLVKDVLAMANIADGGRIVIGIEDGTFARQGLSAAQLATFQPDQMKDLAGQYADPFVEFSVSKASDRAGKQFVIIAVAPFSLSPVICKKDGGSKQELRKGEIYFRSKTRRPCSERISNSSEMRELLDRATVLRMRYLQGLGLQTVPSARYDFDKELDGL